MAIEITYNSITKFVSFRVKKNEKNKFVGKEINRDVWRFILVFEALQVLFIAAFIHWCRTSCNNVAL
jgi:hypothetical protein